MREAWGCRGCFTVYTDAIFLLAPVPTCLPSGQMYSAKAAKDDIILQRKRAKICPATLRNVLCRNFQGQQVGEIRTKLQSLPAARLGGTNDYRQSVHRLGVFGGRGSSPPPFR